MIPTGIQVTSDDAAMARLRLAALDLADGADLSRCDDHQLVEQLAPIAHARVAREQKPVMYRLVAPPPAVAVPAAPPAAAPTHLAVGPALPEVPSISAFSLHLDVAAMVQGLTDAARDGVPFCEECERARQARANA